MNKLIRSLFSQKITDIQFNDGKMNIKINGKKIYDLFQTHLVIKNRNNNKSQYIEVKNKNASIKINELLEIADDEHFDFYLRKNFILKNITRRLKIGNILKPSTTYIEDENLNIRIYSTVYKNISLQLKNGKIHYDIESIESVGKNFVLRGKIIAHNENIKVKTVELLLINRRNKKTIGHDMYYNVENGEFYHIIITESIFINSQMNDRWDVFIQMRDDDNKIVQKSIVDLTNFMNYENEESRYFAKLELEDDYSTILYSTIGKSSFAIWYTDTNQFDKTYAIAKGKTTFSRVAELFDLDEKLIVFESFLGKNYSGNPKYIYEKMLEDKRFEDFTFVWSYCGENPESIKGDPIIVDRKEDAFFEYLAKSKYWVSNIIFPIHQKREGNIYIQTWHGTPLKKLGFDIEISGPETQGRENLYIESRNWDYLISDNRYSSDIFRRAFKYEKEMLETGYPINDIFYTEDINEKMINIKQKLSIPEDKKIILYAPTWRDNEFSGSWEHTFNFKFDLEDMQNRFGEEYVILLRMHHLISDNLEINEKFNEFAFDVSKYDDVQELYVISDLLITDYSSVFYDYANSHRPIIFFAYDFDEYKDNIRGFYMDMEKELPGPIIKTKEELYDAIDDVEKITKDYKHRYEEFYNRFCSLNDGNASQRVVEKICKEM